MGDNSPPRYTAGSGDPVLLLHGFTATWQIWRPVLADLVAHFHVVAPTLPGHSGGPRYDGGAEFSFDRLARWAEAELDAHGLEKVHIVGNSMGASLALELAARGRARSVVAIAPGFDWLPGDPLGPRLAKQFRHSTERTRRSSDHLERAMRPALLRRWLLRNVMRHAERMTAGQAVQMARASIDCSITGAVTEAMATGSAALSGLTAITVPTLIGWPQHDRVVPASLHGKRFADEIRDVQMRTLPGVGHIPTYDDPQLIVETITDWVARANRLTAPA
jgi:pimeloyl-ACP methyl ester carboxylesterase